MITKIDEFKKHMENRMSSSTDLPFSIDELFVNGEYEYYYNDPAREMDNIQSMQFFVEFVNIPAEAIIDDSGTQITITHNGKTLTVDSYGRGDFFSHGFSVSEPAGEPTTESIDNDMQCFGVHAVVTTTINSVVGPDQFIVVAKDETDARRKFRSAVRAGKSHYANGVKEITKVVPYGKPTRQMLKDAINVAATQESLDFEDDSDGPYFYDLLDGRRLWFWEETIPGMAGEPMSYYKFVVGNPMNGDKPWEHAEDIPLREVAHLLKPEDSAELDKLQDEQGDANGASARAWTEKIQMHTKLKDFKLTLESVMEAPEDKKVLMDQIKSIMTAAFPDSYSSVQYIQIMGDPFIQVKFAVGKKEEWPNGYFENDFADHNIMIRYQDDQYSVSSKSGFIYTKPPVGSFNVYGRLKTGWRDFKGNSDVVIRNLTRYFNKLREVITTNADSLVDRDRDLVKKKFNIPA